MKLKTVFWFGLLCSLVSAGPPLGIAPSALTEGEQLQAVIDRGGPIVWIPKGTYQQDVSLRLRSNLTLLCEEGAVIEAAPGAFLPGIDVLEASLIVLDQVANVSIYNCTFKMRKPDYGVYKVRPDGTYDMTPNALGYVPGEWRHSISITGCQRIKLHNVKANLSGGDGLFIGPHITPNGPRIPSRDVTVRQSTFADNYRQGVSVPSCLGECLIEDCVFSGTNGASPQAGIDIEPENGDAVEVTVRRCLSVGNRGPGYMVGLFKNTPTTAPSKIAFEDCQYLSVPADQVNFRLGGVLSATMPNGYMLDNLPAGTVISWDTLIWRK